MPDHKSITRTTEAKPTSQIIARIPHGGMNGPEWGAAVETELVRIWVEEMAPVDLVAFTAAGPRRDQLPASLLARLDKLILDQAEDLGWRMTLSEIVQRRQSDWPPEMHRKFGEACARAREIELGKRSPRVRDPIITDAWTDTIEELRLVLARMRNEFVVLRRRPEPEEMAKRFGQLVVECIEYRQIRAQLPVWLDFIRQNSDTFNFLMNRGAPVDLFLQLQSATSGLAADTLRQKYYRLLPVPTE